jgi:aryl-alcohol dehydrogenase-like predicted oxidoreductase
MEAARRSGINFLGDARYDDETGTAPIPTGYSEVVFGELFRGARWVRDDVIVANKLWWEHWPHQDAATELDGSLARMGLDRIDLIYAMPPPKDLPIISVVREVCGLIESGRARVWGTGRWSAAQLHEAFEMLRALQRGPTGLVAAHALGGGTLTGKYLRGAAGHARGDTMSTARDGTDRAAAVAALALQWGCLRVTWPSPTRCCTRVWPVWCSVPPRHSKSWKTLAPSTHSRRSTTAKWTPSGS